MSRQPATLVPLVVAALLGLPPSGAQAQRCLGGPGSAGQASLGAAVLTSSSARGEEFRGWLNPVLPLVLGARVGRLLYEGEEEPAFTTTAILGFEIPGNGFTLCPIFGIGYENRTETFDGTPVSISLFRVPLGLSAGQWIPLGAETALIPNGRLGALWVRESGSFEGGGPLGASPSESELFVGLGATLSWRAIYLEGDLEWVTGAGRGAVLSGGLGVVFRGF